ncbi:MAG: hypothetical protein IT304_12130 [Dehalococcoidia bacterium]|nr:hypothetical protein [Dehalococcoidia bacterium]
MRRLPSLALVPVLAFLLLASACGGGDGGEKTTATSPVGGGTPLSDVEYLKVFCTGVTNYYEAVNTQPTKEGIAKVVQAYIDSLKAVQPPADLQDYQAAYLKYLQDAVNDPTRLLTQKPPLPAEGARDRLAGKVKDIPECKYPTFLGGN